MTTWVYVKSEPGLWTTGFYGPDGSWNSDSDWDDREKAAARVNYLNGGSKVFVDTMAKIVRDLDALTEAVRTVLVKDLSTEIQKRR